VSNFVTTPGGEYFPRAVNQCVAANRKWVAVASREESAFSRLQEAVHQAGGSIEAAATGSLQKSEEGYKLEVRVFSVVDAKGNS